MKSESVWWNGPTKTKSSIVQTILYRIDSSWWYGLQRKSGKSALLSNCINTITIIIIIIIIMGISCIALFFIRNKLTAHTVMSCCEQAAYNDCRWLVNNSDRRCSRQKAHAAKRREHVDIEIPLKSVSIIMSIFSSGQDFAFCLSLISKRTWCAQGATSSLPLTNCQN